MIRSKKNSILTKIESSIRSINDMLQAPESVKHPSDRTDSKIFISWSKPKSKQVAETLKEIIATCFGDRIEIFISETSISYGDIWYSKILSNINSSDLGIVVMTDENINEPWLMFEAGALSTIPLIPILYGRDYIESPIKQFQGMTSFTNSNQLQKLLSDIGEHLDFTMGSKNYELCAQHLAKTGNTISNFVNKVGKAELLATCRKLSYSRDYQGKRHFSRKRRKNL
jgi:hypothetical protein